jgi:hypothetical protein
VHAKASHACCKIREPRDAGLLLAAGNESKSKLQVVREMMYMRDAFVSVVIVDFMLVFKCT